MAAGRKRKAPAFQFYAGDWLADTFVQALSFEEQGAYLRLLCHQWEAGSIPTDPERVGRLLGGRLDLWPVLEPKFPGGKNPKLEGIRKECEAYHAGQRRKGALGNARKAEIRALLEGVPAGSPAGSLRGAPKDRQGRGAPKARSSSSSSSCSSSVSPEKQRGTPPEPLRADVAEIMVAWEGYVGALAPKTFAANAKHAGQLLDRGCLGDPKAKGVDPPGPQTLGAIMGAIAWLKAETPSAGGFTWNASVRSIEKLRQKWPKIERSASSGKSYMDRVNDTLENL